MFSRCLLGIRALMISQIQDAAARGLNVNVST